MDTNTAMIYLAGIVAVACLVGLIIILKGDVEAGGRAGTNEFFLKAKERKR
jgi:hypothetical protein